MKTICLALLAMMLFAQQPRPKTVVLTWEDTINPNSTTYTVKRATGQCTGTPNFSNIASGLTAKTYTDSTVTVGTYCYVVTATFAGIESGPSNTANPIVPPVEVTLSAVVQ